MHIWKKVVAIRLRIVRKVWGGNIEIINIECVFVYFVSKTFVSTKWRG